MSVVNHHTWYWCKDNSTNRWRKRIFQHMEPSSSNQACKHQFFVICEIIEEKVTGKLRFGALSSSFWSCTTKRFRRFWCEPLKLNCSFLDDSRHTIGDDPFGSISVHVAVSLIMKGPCYNDRPMEITLDLACFFFHVVSFLPLCSIFQYTTWCSCIEVSYLQHFAAAWVGNARTLLKSR